MRAAESKSGGFPWVEGAARGLGGERRVGGAGRPDETGAGPVLGWGDRGVESGMRGVASDVLKFCKEVPKKITEDQPGAGRQILRDGQRNRMKTLEIVNRSLTGGRRRPRDVSKRYLSLRAACFMPLLSCQNHFATLR